MQDQLNNAVLRQPGNATFLNARLMAVNALEIAVPDDVLAELAEPATEVRAMEAAGQTCSLRNGVRLHNAVPAGGWRSDIRWLSHADVPSYRWFETYFERLKLAETVAFFVPHDAAIRLYAGLFVTRSRCDALDMHHDWATAGNEAFTVMIPLTANAERMGLAYEDARGARRTYDYRMGRGIVFGSNFLHSTAIGRLPERAVFLCMNFGTDRMEHWPELALTTGTQARFHCRPDGVFATSSGARAVGS